MVFVFVYVFLSCQDLIMYKYVLQLPIYICSTGIYNSLLFSSFSLFSSLASIVSYSFFFTTIYYFDSFVYLAIFLSLFYFLSFENNFSSKDKIYVYPNCSRPHLYFMRF